MNYRTAAKIVAEYKKAIRKGKEPSVDFDWGKGITGYSMSQFSNACRVVGTSATRLREELVGIQVGGERIVLSEVKNEPVVEATPEPVVEATPEPVVVAPEPVPEPVVEATPEPVVEAAPTISPEPAVDYSSWSMRRLRSKAREMGVTVPSRPTKKELISAIENAE